MKNYFEALYLENTRLEKAYEEAGTDTEKKAIADAHNTLMQELENKGEIALWVWRNYEISRKNGNEMLDISEVLWDNKVAGLIECLRDCGITAFTFSSTWSSAVETAWLFTKEGCTLEGIIEIKGNKNFLTRKQEMKHGYLFKVN